MLRGIYVRHMTRVVCNNNGRQIIQGCGVRFNSSKKEAFDFEDIGFLESIVMAKEVKKEQTPENTSFHSVLEEQSKQLKAESIPQNQVQVEIPDDQDVTDTLNVFLNLTFDDEEPTKSFDELLQEIGNDSTSESKATSPIDIMGESEISQKSEIVEAEAQVFRNVFDMYMKKDKETEASARKNKMDTFKLVRTSINSILDSNGLINASPSSSFDDMVLTKTQTALKPTLSYIEESLVTKNDVVVFFKNILSRFIELAHETKDDPAKLEEIYLRLALSREHHNQNDTSSDINSSEQLFKRIAEISTALPSEPTLNVATLPIIFNRILHVLVFKFRDGDLPITLYNLLQENLSLYTVLCNQQTFNEILRATWIYRGKTLLQDVTSIYLEMVNNGFKGDIVTFNILKQIVVDYYRLKVGQYTGINEESRLPIWSTEDDKHVQRLRRHLAYLSNRLRLKLARV